MDERIRQPVVVVLGHVDSGKTLLLDKIRGTAVQAREVGGITQHIGASFFPIETLNRICGPLLNKVGRAVQIPGLLVIDTPGHQVFTNLRIRGGSAADISILVIDVTRGFEVQTYESIEILRRRKVPFVVALNKIDLISGWRPSSSPFLSQSLEKQAKEVTEDLDKRVYSVVGVLSRLGFISEVFYRVKDFTKEVAIAPVSAKTGEGIPELMAVMIGLAQQYLKSRLAVTTGPSKGIVFEVKEEIGLGQTANVILLDGVLKIGDSIVLGKREGAFLTRVKAIFLPKPLDEMRDPRDKFTSVNEVAAAAGVMIVTPDLEGVLAGSPLLGLKETDRPEDVLGQVEREIKTVFVKTDLSGLIVRSDTLGTLEAILDMLTNKEVPVPIRIADIGPVNKRDVLEAALVAEKNRFLGVILAFGVKILPDAEKEALIRDIKIFSYPIIYDLIQHYLDWVIEQKESLERKEFSTLVQPCKFRILKGFIFRRSNPAIVGVEIMYGRLKQKATVMDLEGRPIGSIHQIQDTGKSIEIAEKGSQVAISMNEPTVGKQVDEGDTLYTLPAQDEVKLLLTKYGERLGEEGLQILKEIIGIRKKESPMYG